MFIHYFFKGKEEREGKRNTHKLVPTFFFFWRCDCIKKLLEPPACGKVHSNATLDAASCKETGVSKEEEENNPVYV